MTGDRELLEMAARAAGYRVKRESEQGLIVWIGDEPACWNPLTDDGDALRLAVKLMEFEPYRSRGYIPCIICDAAATRRAIVRAAAAIGMGMREFPRAEEIRENWT